MFFDNQKQGSDDELCKHLDEDFLNFLSLLEGFFLFLAQLFHLLSMFLLYHYIDILSMGFEKNSLKKLQKKPLPRRFRVQGGAFLISDYLRK